jgi:hypothetical protein
MNQRTPISGGETASRGQALGVNGHVSRSKKTAWDLSLCNIFVGSEDLFGTKVNKPDANFYNLLNEREYL